MFCHHGNNNILYTMLVANVVSLHYSKTENHDKLSLSCHTMQAFPSSHYDVCVYDCIVVVPSVKCLEQHCISPPSLAISQIATNAGVNEPCTCTANQELINQSPKT